MIKHNFKPLALIAIVLVMVFAIVSLIYWSISKKEIDLYQCNRVQMAKTLNKTV